MNPQRPTHECSGLSNGVALRRPSQPLIRITLSFTSNCYLSLPTVGLRIEGTQRGPILKEKTRCIGK
jgi:hypothetical protein